MTDKDFRKRVLDALDVWYEKTGGSTPDHLIVSESKYEALSVERLNRGGHDSDYLDSGEGYVGMVLWKTAKLDEKEADAVMLTDEDFRELFPQSKDF